MTNTIGSTKNLDTSRKEALQGLLSSLKHAKDNPSPNAKLSAEQVQKLSEKINEILGDSANHGPIQPSQLLNEEGLPIIDISEPADDSPSSSSLSFVPEPEFLPLSLLPPDEKERQRRERDRILDLLEEEERLQQLQEEWDAEEERKERIRKRKESAKAELEQLKAAQELQKKMGKALVRHAKGTEEKIQDEDARPKAQVTSPVAKKSVSFADTPGVEADTKDQQVSTRQPDWGDVSLGRLRAQDRIPLVSAAEAQKYPMKMHVVERHPTAASPSFHNDADSDDESVSAGDLPPHSDDGPSDGKDMSSSSDNELLNEPVEEGFDYDVAQHHREIALEYHQKRHAIGAETAKVMAAHAFDDYEHETSPLSRFRADRMAATYDRSREAVSTRVGQTVSPASRQRSLQSSVRMGKVEDNQLVGGESGESGSEDETVRDVIQMLKTGDIQNAGPNFKPSLKSSITRHDSDVVEPTVGMSSTTAHGIQPSKFKLTRGGGVTERATFQDNDNNDNAQPRCTVPNVIERRAPRSSPGQRFPVNKPPRSSVKASESVPPMIINSPSFPLPASTSIVVPSPSPTQGSTIQPGMTPRDPSSAKRPISKFMAERRK